MTLKWDTAVKNGVLLSIWPINHYWLCKLGIMTSGMANTPIISFTPFQFQDK